MKWRFSLSFVFNFNYYLELSSCVEFREGFFWLREKVDDHVGKTGETGIKKVCANFHIELTWNFCAKIIFVLRAKFTKICL